MNFLKKILFKVLPEKAYVRILHRSFYLLYNLGFLKKDKRFKYHYAIKKIIKPHYVVVDIGANLGYFAKNFAKLTPKGKVICIEPVPLFNETLRFFLKRYKQVEIHSFALGKADGMIKMALPKTNGVLRTGLPHILQTDEKDMDTTTTIDVEIKSTRTFFSGLKKIDYLKCDIEGYEKHVFEEIKELLFVLRPIVQIEIAEENRPYFFEYFKALNYIQYGIVNSEIIEEFQVQKEEGDFLFIPQEKSNLVKELNK